MPKPKFNRIKTDGQSGGSSILDEHIGHVDEAFRAIGDVVNNDKLVTVVFAADDTSQTFAHGLKGPVKTIDIVRKNAASDVFEVSSDAKLITLHATLACIVVVRLH